MKILLIEVAVYQLINIARSQGEKQLTEKIFEYERRRYDGKAIESSEIDTGFPA